MRSCEYMWIYMANYLNIINQTKNKRVTDLLCCKASLAGKFEELRFHSHVDYVFGCKLLFAIAKATGLISRFGWGSADRAPHMDNDTGRWSNISSCCRYSCSYNVIVEQLKAMRKAGASWIQSPPKDLPFLEGTALCQAKVVSHFTTHFIKPKTPQDPRISTLQPHPT